MTTSVDGEVLDVMLRRHDEHLTSGQIHRLIGRYSHEGVRKSLARLSAEGIIDREWFDRVWVYAMNDEHVAFSALMAVSQTRRVLIDRISDLIGTWAVSPAYAGVGIAVRSGASGIDIILGRDGEHFADESAWDDQIIGLESRVTRWTGGAPVVHDLLRSELLGEALLHPPLKQLSRSAEVIVGDQGWLFGIDVPEVLHGTSLGAMRGEQP